MEKLIFYYWLAMMTYIDCCVVPLLLCYTWTMLTMKKIVSGLHKKKKKVCMHRKNCAWLSATRKKCTQGCARARGGQTGVGVGVKFKFPPFTQDLNNYFFFFLICVLSISKFIKITITVFIFTPKIRQQLELSSWWIPRSHARLDTKQSSRPLEQPSTSP
jgi:hypothetical protein